MKVYFEKKFLCVVLADGREVKVLAIRGASVTEKIFSVR
jgi:hypothetical protein